MIWKEAVLWAIKDCVQQKGESIFTRKELVEDYLIYFVYLKPKTLELSQ